MQLGDHFTVLLGSGCRDDMHNQMGRITLARFGEVSLIANPLRLTFDAVMRLKVKGEQIALAAGGMFPARRQCIVPSPMKNG